jgi:hypothetical protein
MPFSAISKTETANMSILDAVRSKVRKMLQLRKQVAVSTDEHRIVDLGVPRSSRGVGTTRGSFQRLGLRFLDHAGSGNVLSGDCKRATTACRPAWSHCSDMDLRPDLRFVRQNGDRWEGAMDRAALRAPAWAAKIPNDLRLL